MSNADTKTYEVTSPFRFGGRDYAAGSPIELTRDEARSPGLAKRIGKPGAKATAAESAAVLDQKQVEEIIARAQSDVEEVLAQAKGEREAAGKTLAEASSEREAADKARAEAAADLEAAKAERAEADKARSEAAADLETAKAERAAAEKAKAETTKGGAKK